LKFKELEWNLPVQYSTMYEYCNFIMKILKSPDIVRYGAIDDFIVEVGTIPTGTVPSLHLVPVRLDSKFDMFSMTRGSHIHIPPPPTPSAERIILLRSRVLSPNSV
jgi:hypothetical protein